MPQRPVPAVPGPEDSGPGAQPEPDPDWARLAAHPDPRTEQDREAWLDHLVGLEEPFDPEEWWDPEGPPRPDEDRLTSEELAEISQADSQEQFTHFLKAEPAGQLVEFLPFHHQAAMLAVHHAEFGFGHNHAI